MSKYDPLWTYIQNNASPSLTLSFAQAEEILGFPIDHSFLQYKKELPAYGYQVGKISLKKETVLITKLE